jgi:hypothetical protein
MGILDKLRPAPRWKHADPAVRAAAAYELGPEDADALHALAREDAEPRVRRAAVARLTDVPTLGDIAGTDPDEEVRHEAIRGLAGLAAESSDVGAASVAVTQLLALGRLKEVVAVARDGVHASVRAAVVDLVEDQKSLGSISRHAPDATTRLRALAQLTDLHELLNIASKSEHTDVAVAALERISDEESLRTISQRARNKVAARRARTKLRAVEETVQPPPGGTGVVMSPDDLRRATELLHRTEALVAVVNAEQATSMLSDVRLAWAELQADVEIDPALAQRFEAACEASREAIAERQRERAAEEERARLALQEQADRISICEEIDQLSGALAADRVAELKVRWDNLAPMPSEYAASLTRRFQDACRGFEERERRRVLAEAASARLETLATELEQLLGLGQSSEQVVARWRGLRRDAEVLREHTSANPAAGERLERAMTALEEKEHEQQLLRTKHEQDNLKRLQQICRHVQTLAELEALTLRAGDRALRDIRSALEDRLPLPTKKDRQEIQAKLEAARAKLAPRVQSLREADEWQRWANLQVQEDLCREMEALRTEENVEIAGRKMRALQARWKQVALAPRAQGEAMWRRFKTAQDEVFHRASTHFAAQNEERQAHLAKKTELCERAEAMAGSIDWVKTAAELRQLQEQWKTIGPVTRGQEKAIWERFRAACDRFFTRRHEDLKQRKQEWTANLAKKEALCVRAEALAESVQWEEASAEIKQLQSEWKKVGPVRRSKSEAIWQRFRAACDRFFERYKNRDQVELQSKAVVRDAIIKELEALLPPDGGEPGQPPETVYTIVQEARQRWQHAPELPRQMQQDFSARYQRTLGRLMTSWPGVFSDTELDPHVTRKRMEKLVARMEELAPAPARPQGSLSPAELLAQQWRERLAANTITGGRGAEIDETRWRAAEQEVRQAQAQWARLGPMPPDVAGPLNERFQQACRRFYDLRRRAS